MVLHKVFAHLGVAEQKSAELLGEYIVLADRIPRLGRHLVFFIARLGYFAEITVGDVFDLIVIVKHDAAMTRHAEVFIQHIARENIRPDQFFNRIAVFKNTMFHRFIIAAFFRFGEPDIERHHAPFYIHVLDNDFVVIDF